MQLINIHVCQNSQRKSLCQVSTWNLWNPRELLSSLETGKCRQDVYGETGIAEKMDLASHQKICSSAARKYDSHVSSVSFAFFIQAFFDGNPFLPLFHEYLARAWCNILCLRDKPAKSMGGMKNAAADCRAHSTFSASLISASFIVMTATGVQKVAFSEKHFHTTLLEGKGNKGQQ